MTDFTTRRLSSEPDVVAPDGSDVRILPGLAGGGMAHFELAPSETSRAVAHRTVEEIWFFLSGRGEMWRRQLMLVDARRLVDLWIEHYDAIPERQRRLLPLRPVYYLFPEE